MSKVVKKLESGVIHTKVYRDGSLWYEKYELNGDYHREDGPAFIEYNRDGSIHWESYWSNDERHREDGPAWINYHRDGSLRKESYYLNNKAYNKKDYEAWQQDKEADEIIDKMLASV